MRSTARRLCMSLQFRRPPIARLERQSRLFGAQAKQQQTTVRVVSCSIVTLLWTSALGSLLIRVSEERDVFDIVTRSTVGSADNPI